MRWWGAGGLALAAALALQCGMGPSATFAATPAQPIPSRGPAPSLPAYSGAPASPRPIRGVPPTPRNPFLAPNGLGLIHNDGWQTDAYRWRGPLGKAPRTQSTNIGRECGSITFDSRGRIVSICVNREGPRLYMFNRHSLATLAQFPLPRRSEPSGFHDFTGGGYFYLDRHNHVWTSTTTRHIWDIAERGTGFIRVHDYDLTHKLRRDETINSALPDSRGLIWFVTKLNGAVGTLDPATGRVRVKRVGHGERGEIVNSIAVGKDGSVYVVSNRKLYRFRAGADGRPEIVWQASYPNTGVRKPSQVDAGSGTTPTVMPGGYVAIADNADPMDVVVYRTARKLPRGTNGRRLSRRVCAAPVFTKGASATENSLIGAGRALIVENNYGYDSPGPRVVSKPGLARVDVDRDGHGCHLVWTNRIARAPSVVPKLSLASGLIYTYTRPPDPSGAQGYYWTAIDFRTGRTVWRQFAGTGPRYNNNYAGIAIARDGATYLGTFFGGIVALRDATGKRPLRRTSACGHCTGDKSRPVAITPTG